MKKPDFKNLNFFALIKYLYPATIVLIVIVLLLLIKFLYSNVYQTIISAELITDLRKEISETSLKKDKFNKVVENIKAKLSIVELNTNQIKDPFQNLPVGEAPKP